jgi:signal transduction histidine kinase
MSRYAIEDGRVRAGDKFGTIAPRSPSAGVLRWLESDQAPEEVMKIVVADSGPGVPLEDRERVFDPFFSTRAPSEGAGLGLAIVLRIVESLEGIVWVESSREGGAAFHVMLPLAASFLCAAPIGMAADAPFPALF